jgi:hypothetical protein
MLMSFQTISSLTMVLLSLYLGLVFIRVISACFAQNWVGDSLVDGCIVDQIETYFCTN